MERNQDAKPPAGEPHRLGLGAVGLIKQFLDYDGDDDDARVIDEAFARIHSLDFLEEFGPSPSRPPAASRRRDRSAEANAGDGESGNDSDVVCVSGPPLRPGNNERARKPSSSDVVDGVEYPVYLDCLTSTLYDEHPLTAEGGGWIWARGPNGNNDDGELPPDVENLALDFARAKAEHAMAKDKSDPRRITIGTFKDMAARHGVTKGKWLIYANPDSAAPLWTKVRDAQLEGKLGPTAKIAKDLGEGWGRCFVVCIYCRDFRDRADVLRVRRAIDDVTEGEEKRPMLFKPDAMTHLNIYAKNEYNIRTSIYECGGKSDPECETLIAVGENCVRRRGGRDCPHCFPVCRG